MCGLLTLLLIGLGFFGFFGISSSVSVPIGSVEVTAMYALPTFTPAPLMAEPTPFATEPPKPLILTPSPTPFPTITAARVMALTATPSPVTPPDSPQVLSICAPSPISDLQIAAQLDNNTLQSPEWMLSAAASDTMTRFTFTANRLGGIGMIEVLHYDCGYTDADIETFFSDSGWDTIFASYEAWEATAACAVDELRLHEFAVTFGGGSYDARYWITPVNDQRVAVFMLVLPKSAVDQMDAYAERLFTELPSCDAP
jgi:hypothetical protein